MTLLRLISWQYARRHLLRTLLTSTGIALGVTVFVAMHAATETVTSAFATTVDRVAGKTELQVSAGDGGFDEAILETVQATPGVRVAVPAIEAIVDSRLPGQGNLYILGVDMTGDRSLRDYDLEQGEEAEIDDPLIFLAQPDSIILSREFAARNHIQTGSRLTLGTAEGDKAFVVRGLMKSAAGLATAFGGSLAVMDIYAAQKMFGRGRTFDRIDLALQPGASLTDVQQRLRQTLGGAFDVLPPSGRGQQFESMIASYSVMMNITSAFALFIGMFLIYNAFEIAVTQRRFEIGVLRAIGATQAQVRRLFLVEGAVLGLIGSAIGVALGIGFAGAAASWISTLVSNVYGVAQKTEALTTDPAKIALALALGIGASILASALPARDAASLDPVLVLQKGRAQQVSAAEYRRRLVWAVAFAVLSLVSFLWASARVLVYAGFAATVLAAVLLGPWLAFALARLLRPLLTGLRPVEGLLASDSLILSPRRLAGSVIALMFSIALVVAFAGIAQASYGSILSWMHSTLDPDLFVLPSQSLDVQTTRFPIGIGAELKALPGVARVQTLRNTRVNFRGTSAMVVAVEVASVAETAHLPPVEGNAADMYARAGRGEGVMVSENLAELQHLSLGQVLEIPAPHGTLKLPIVGVVIDYSDQQGAIIMDRALFLEYWHDDTVNAFRVYVDPSHRVDEVRNEILVKLAPGRQMFVLTNDQLKAYIQRVAGQWFSLTWVQIAVAVIVAVLGIVNSLTVSITDRRREFAVMRAIGGLESQIRRAILLEAVSVVVIGLALGCALGAVDLFYVLDMVRRDIAGMRLAYEFPMTTALMLIPVMIAAALAAAAWPARASMRGRLVEALEYE